MHKYKNLDGLRGLAAFVVVAWHYSLGFMPALSGAFLGVATANKSLRTEDLFATTPLHLFFAGPSAVTLFFVLSGFVLSVKFFQHKDTTIITSSALRRYLRLMIPALVSIILTYFILRLGFNYETVTRTYTHSPWLYTLWNFPAHFWTAIWQGMYSLFFTLNDPNSLTSYNFNLWTMHYELLGSFIVFGIMALVGKLQNRWIIYIILALAMNHTFYLSFILGLILADIWVNYGWIKELFSDKICWTLLPIGLFMFGFYIPAPHLGIYSHFVIPGYGQNNTLILFQTIGSVILIVSVLRLKILTRFFELKPLQFLGVNSFALYVIHLAILGSLASFLYNHLVFRIGHPGAFVVSFMIAVPVTLVASRFYTKYVDNTAIAVSRAFGNAIMTKKLSFPSIPKHVEQDSAEIPAATEVTAVE